MLTLAAAAVLWVVVAAHVLRRRHTMPQLDGVLGLLATAMTVKGLMALSLVGGVAPRVVTYAAAAAAGVMAVELLRRLVAEGKPTSRFLPWALRLTAVAYVAVATVLSLIGASSGEIGRAVGGEQVVYDSPTVMTALYCTSGAWFAAVTAWMVWLLLRLVDISPPGPIRHALALTASGVTGLVVYELLWLMQGVVDPMNLSAPWATAGILVFKASVAVIGWAYLRATFLHPRLLGRWRDRRALVALQPLWRQLEPLDPAVALFGYPTRIDQLSAANLKLALWRAMVEIREWLDMVATRVPAGTLEAAQTLAQQRHGPGKHATRLAGQTWIQLGLNATADTHLLPDERPPVGQDLDEELALLLNLVPRPGDRAELSAVSAAVMSQARLKADIPRT